MLNISNYQKYNINYQKLKNTVRYHLTPTRIAIIKKSTHNECWKV